MMSVTYYQTVLETDNTHTHTDRHSHTQNDKAYVATC